MKLCGGQFPKHHEHMLFDCITIVKNEHDHYINWTTMKYASDVQMLEKTISTTTLGKLAYVIVDCMDTVRAKKNLNSHGATLGAAICPLSSIISGLRKASEEEPNPDMNELIPHCVIHTGHKYGNTQSVYTEYMVSTCESQIICGRDEIYLNAERFNQENHTDVVNKMFSETVEGYPSIPAPRPTHTHTYNFGCTFMGACLINGECKDTATDADKGFLVLHCLDQLVTQDVALCLLMTSEKFYFYRTMKNDKHIKITCWETNAYTLEYVGKEDLYKEDWIVQPPTPIPISGEGMMIWENIQLRQHDKSIIASWKCLRSGLQGSFIQCLIQLTFWLNTLVPSIWKKSDIREQRHGRRDGKSLISCLQMSVGCKLKGR